MPCSIGVIGLGRMAQAIVVPLIERGDFEPHQILGVVKHQESLRRIQEHLPRGIQVFTSDDPDSMEVWKAPVKLLAIKPQQLGSIEPTANKLKPEDFVDKPLLISLLAGVRLKRLMEVFRGHSCVRAVPNAPALVGAGLTGLSLENGLTRSDQLLVEKIFNPISEIVELPEDQLDAFLALTSSGPAYIALIVEALADGAVAAGLPRLLANQLACRTLFGTSLLLQEKELHPGQLKDMVASPGGTTINALRHLEKAGLRSALMEAVVAAAERSRELA